MENARRVLGYDATRVEPPELAAAFTDLLLNVYPYASVFCEPAAEMNGERARRMDCLYGEYDFAPEALRQVGAPDHIGIMLEFLAHAGDAVILPLLLDWAPVLCLAVEREPGAHPFYRALARETRQRLFVHARAAGYTLPPREASVPRVADAETRLADVLQFFLAPARCGIFFSRAQCGALARRMGLRLPFGSRWEVARALFMGMGEAARVDALLFELHVEIAAWSNAYMTWARECPAWRPYAEIWLARAARAQTMTHELRAILAHPPELEIVVA